jgi:hypothetical protein
LIFYSHFYTWGKDFHRLVDKIALIQGLLCKIPWVGADVAMDNLVQNYLNAVIHIIQTIYYQPPLLLNIYIIRGRTK